MPRLGISSAAACKFIQYLITLIALRSEVHNDDMRIVAHDHGHTSSAQGTIAHAFAVQLLQSDHA